MDKIALLSVSDKTGIAGFAAGLAELGYTIVSTGGTAEALGRAGVPCVAVQDLTGFPECLDGRVKTLHPSIHGGLLAVRDDPGHMERMRELGVRMIDLVAVNLYPFVQTVSKPGVALGEAIEQIDIGGPAMVRSAAKNHRYVTVIVDPEDYVRALAELRGAAIAGKDEGEGWGACKSEGHARADASPVSGEGAGSACDGAACDMPALAFRYELACKAFAHTAAYDAAVAEYLAARLGDFHAKASDAKASAGVAGVGGAACHGAVPAKACGAGACGVAMTEAVESRAGVVESRAGAVDSGAGAVNSRACVVDSTTGAVDSGTGGGDCENGDCFPDKLELAFTKTQDMRYGENPHQRAAFYAEPAPAPGTLATLRQLHGKELSYNNIGDLDGALAALEEFDAPTAVAVKHGNPCGVGCAASLAEAFEKARDCDAESIYGGVVALNRPVDAATAEQIGKIFIEIVAAPSFDADALAILGRKKNIRLIAVDTGAARDRHAKEASREQSRSPLSRAFAAKPVSGGLLVQEADSLVFDRARLAYPTALKPTERQLDDMEFAMAVVKHARSNAIVIANGLAAIGVGPGQVSRVMAAKIAIERAGARARGAVAASDAFFPFPDCVELLAEAGVKAIVHPGGSKNDAASVEACDRLGLAMAMTGLRHFRH